MPPLNLVGDFGGGALYLVVGVWPVAGGLEVRQGPGGGHRDVRRGVIADVNVLWTYTRAGTGHEGRDQIFSTAARVSTAYTMHLRQLHSMAIQPKNYGLRASMPT